MIIAAMTMEVMTITLINSNPHPAIENFYSMQKKKANFPCNLAQLNNLYCDEFPISKKKKKTTEKFHLAYNFHIKPTTLQPITVNNDRQYVMNDVILCFTDQLEYFRLFTL